MSVVSPSVPAPAPVNQAPRSEPAILRPLLVIAGVGAAAVHFGYAPAHLDVNTVQGVFFLTVAWLQLGWALALVKRPSPLVYRLGILLNAVVLGVWLVSRTAGISGDVEPFGFPDIVASGLAAFIVIGSFGPLTRRLPHRQLRSITSGAVLGACTLAVTALVSASMVPSLSGHEAGTHGGSGSQTNEIAAASAGHHDGTAKAATGTAKAATGADHAEAVPYDPEMPIDLGGVAGVTPKQQAEAENLVANTLIGLPQWADQAVAEAAGFRSIGDGLTGTEHLVNQAFMDDNVILDPNKPESLVYDVKNGKKTLAAAMYMVARGTPLADVPKLGGSLMQWHTHQNLCYNAQGKVAGITDADGNCPKGLVKPEETPMIHVWIRPHPCGPFAALEGIGAGAIAEGETRLCDTAHGS